MIPRWLSSSHTRPATISASGAVRSPPTPSSEVRHFRLPQMGHFRIAIDTWARYPPCRPSAPGIRAAPWVPEILSGRQGLEALAVPSIHETRQLGCIVGWLGRRESKDRQIGSPLFRGAVAWEPREVVLVKTHCSSECGRQISSFQRATHPIMDHTHEHPRHHAAIAAGLRESVPAYGDVILEVAVSPEVARAQRSRLCSPGFQATEPKLSIQ